MGAEMDGVMTVTAELSIQSGKEITVPYVVTGIATDPDDY